MQNAWLLGDPKSECGMWWTLRILNLPGHPKYTSSLPFLPCNIITTTVSTFSFYRNVTVIGTLLTGRQCDGPFGSWTYRDTLNTRHPCPFLPCNIITTTVSTFSYYRNVTVIDYYNDRSLVWKLIVVYPYIFTEVTIHFSTGSEVTLSFAAATLLGFYDFFPKHFFNLHRLLGSS